MSKKKFLDIIENQRKNKKEKKFEGTFLEYLELVSKNPDIVKMSHKRLYDSITTSGIEVMDDSEPRKRKIFDNDNVKIYSYFKEEFFGMERVISKIMRFLNSASKKGEESRQVLLLMGPVGAGKSALTEYIKKSIDGESYYHLKGDPQRGEPLHLVPRNLREKFEKLLKTRIEGDISPVARHMLLEEYAGKYEDFQVTETTFSQRARRGIASVRACRSI